MAFRGFFLLLLVAPGIVSAQSLLTLDQVLDALVESYGGEQNLMKLDRVVQKWELHALTGDKKGTDHRYISAPDKLRVELSYPMKTETRVLNGQTGYIIFNKKNPRVTSVAHRDAMRLQMMRMYSPLSLRRRVGRMSLAEQKGILVLTLAEHGVRTDYLVDKKNWRIEKVAGTLSINGSKMQFLTEYSDFEMVDGVLIHRRENKYAGGINTARLKLQEIILNPVFSDALFEPKPAAAPSI